MVQAIYVPKDRAIYAKAHIRAMNKTVNKAKGDRDLIRVYDADPFYDEKRDKHYWRIVIAGDKKYCSEIISMTGDYYQPTKIIKQEMAIMRKEEEAKQKEKAKQ